MVGVSPIRARLRIASDALWEEIVTVDKACFNYIKK
jgi:hypothetical protein